MNELQLSAFAVTPPATIATNGTAELTIDTRGYNFANVLVNFGTAATNAAELTTFGFNESDDTVATNFTAIIELTGGTAAGNFTLPTSAAIGAGGISQFQIDLRKRKRYLQMLITPGAARIIGAIAELGRAEQSPLTASDKSVLNRAATSATAIATIVQV